MIEYWLGVICAYVTYIVAITLGCCMIWAMPQIFYEFVNNYKESHIIDKERHKLSMKKLRREIKRIEQ